MLYRHDMRESAVGRFVGSCRELRRLRVRLRRVGALKRQLLVVEEAVGKQGMVVGHRNLHRLDDALKLLNAGEHFLHSRQVSPGGLRAGLQVDIFLM